jgi:hypothetical protein
VIPDHTQPFHLLFIKFFTSAAMVGHDPILEIFSNRFGERRHRGIDAADTTDQRNKRRKLAARVITFVIIKQGVGTLDA